MARAVRLHLEERADIAATGTAADNYLMSIGPSSAGQKSQSANDGAYASSIFQPYEVLQQPQYHAPQVDPVDANFDKIV